MVNALVGAELCLCLDIWSIRCYLDSNNLDWIYRQLTCEEQMSLWGQVQPDLMLFDPLAGPHKHSYRSGLPDSELTFERARLHFGYLGSLLRWTPQIDHNGLLLLLSWEECDDSRSA